MVRTNLPCGLRVDRCNEIRHLTSGEVLGNKVLVIVGLSPMTKATPYPLPPAKVHSAAWPRYQNHMGRGADCWQATIRRRSPSLCSLVLLSGHPHLLYPLPRSGELRTQKLKSHLLRTQSFKVFPSEPGVGQYIAIHATRTARDFSLVYFHPSGPFTCIFSKHLSIFFS